MDINFILWIIIRYCYDSCMLHLSQFLVSGLFHIVSCVFTACSPQLLSIHFQAPEDVLISSCILPAPALVLFIRQQCLETKI